MSTEFYSKLIGSKSSESGCCSYGPNACNYPQQNNEDDCGAFLCCGALHAMYGKEPLFTPSDIAAFRGHIAWRLLRGDDWDKPE